MLQFQNHKTMREVQYKTTGDVQWLYVTLFPQVEITSGYENKGNWLHLFNFTLYTLKFSFFKFT